MSGGSFNYLCFADATDLLSKHRPDLADMAANLTNRGYKDAALETERLIAYVDHAERQITARMERLQKVWKAVEWNCSGDSGPEEVREAVEEYRNA